LAAYRHPHCDRDADPAGVQSVAQITELDMQKGTTMESNGMVAQPELAAGPEGRRASLQAADSQAGGAFDKQLLRWRLAQDAAGRANRNMLQAAAAIAAIIGIEAGAGGIFKLAEALQVNAEGGDQLVAANAVQTPAAAPLLLGSWATWVPQVAAGIGLIFAVLLLVFLCSSAVHRVWAERATDRRLDELLRLDAGRFRELLQKDRPS
jgi:hypothetical protein